MAKVILGARPANFAPFAVKFPMPDGSEGVIKATYKYRTRVEFGAMLDAIVNQAAAVDAVAPEAEPVADAVPVEATPFKVDYAGLYAKSRDATVEHLLHSVTGWDLDVPFTPAALKQLADEIPAACIALMAAYNAACTEGRLGN